MVIIIKIVTIIIISRINRIVSSCFRCVVRNNSMKINRIGRVWDKKFIALRESTQPLIYKTNAII